jgi:Cu-Zn family superoxide dismutase
MQVTYMLDGLSEGVYGFHVHENGSCANGEDGTAGGAAGGHFNPDGAAHGAPNLPVGQRHLGDLGNIHAVSDGRILGSFNESIAALDGPDSIVGKALIIHADEDDFTTQPTGNAGARIGCGVITSVEA